MDSGHWNIDLVGEFDPADWIGFVYEVCHVRSGKLYVGKKNFRVGKGRKMRTSNWKEYTTSCQPINQCIARGGKFTFKILSLHKTASSLKYEEAKQIISRDALYAVSKTGKRLYYNNAVMIHIVIKEKK